MLNIQAFITLSKQNQFSIKPGCTVLFTEGYCMQNIILQLFYQLVCNRKEAIRKKISQKYVSLFLFSLLILKGNFILSVTHLLEEIAKIVTVSNDWKQEATESFYSPSCKTSLLVPVHPWCLLF